MLVGDGIRCYFFVKPVASQIIKLDMDINQNSRSYTFPSYMIQALYHNQTEVLFDGGFLIF